MAEHPDVERFRRVLEWRAQGPNDAGPLEDTFDEDITWHGAPASGDQARGREQILHLWVASAGRDGEPELQVGEVYADGVHTVASLRRAAGGRTLEQAIVFHLDDDGKVTELWSIPSDHALAEALARGEPAPEHPNLPTFRTAEETRGRNTFEPQDIENINAFLREDVRWISAWGPGPSNRDEVIAQFKAFKEATGGTIHMHVNGVFADDAHALSFVELTASRPDKPERRMDLKEVNLFHLDENGRAYEFWGIQDDPAKTDEFWAP